MWRENYRQDNSFRVFVLVNVVEETSFKIVISVIGDLIKSDKFFEIKNAWKREDSAKKMLKKVGCFKGYSIQLDSSSFKREDSS